ncbi:MAG TPA: oligosaccharide flippase family protein [Pyrinomonadaceae bacterium]|jgi:stage V sporulation protein B
MSAVVNPQSEVPSRPSLANSSKWVFAGTFFSKPVQLLTNVFLARMLGPAGFGVFGLATSMAVTLSLIAGLGLGDASYKYVAEYYRSDKQQGARLAAVIVWSTTIFCSVLFLALWLLREFWAHYIFPPSVSGQVISLCLCLAGLNLLFAIVLGVLAGLQRFREYTILNLSQAVGIVAFVILLGFRGTIGALLAYVIGSALAIAWGLWTLLRIDRALVRWPSLKSFGELKRMLNFSAPIWISSFSLTPIVTLTFVLLTRTPDGDYQLGLFNTANGLRMLIVILPSIIATVITPALIQEGGERGNHEAFGSLLEKSFSALALTTIPLLVTCLFLSDLLLSIYGKAYGGSFRLFMPLVAAAGIGAIGAPLITVMMAKNKTWWSLVFGILKSVLLLALCWWWIPNYQATGLAWAFTISEITFYVIALEFCIGTSSLSNSVRWDFYSSMLAVAVLLMLALSLPPTARWIIAIPLTVAVFVFILRNNRPLAKWLPNMVPAALRPSADQLLSFIAN